MYHADVAQLVERDLAKVEVAGSSPVVRSNLGAFRIQRGVNTFAIAIDTLPGYAFSGV
jgi:hypothetical protein